jgi:phospholipid/cholesterol/gamma-HCH transport system permease protein
LFNFLKGPIQAIQDFYILTGQAIWNMFRSPHYGDDIIVQMDSIGVGSISIVLLTGFFSGAIMALQMGRALAQYGQTGRTGMVVAIILVRELGPVLTAVVMAGRNSSGIASELGSMKVTEQIDAMRALGTDPIQKLVTPRVIATMIMLPCLTVIADFVGMVGGYIVAHLVFSFVVSLVGCYYGLRTSGGTQGVGRATTQAVVVASVLIFILTFFIGKVFVSQAPS